jgi:FKBP-type peptidyl-prolyl cis-trans isomerase
MKSNWLVLSLILLMTGGLINGCGNDFSGFEDTGNNLYYKFHDKQECDNTPVIGDLVSFVMKVYGDDTVYSEAYPVHRQRLEPSVYAGDLYEAIGLMCVGDSATFILSSDSLNFYYGNNQMGAFPGTHVFIDVKLSEIFTLAMQERERDSLISIENKILADYRENYMLGFTEIAPGVFFKETLQGRGAAVMDTSIISVKLIGATLEGEVFFPEEEEPLDFRLMDDYGIPFNWNEAMRQLREGSKATIILSSPNAFGSAGFPMGNVGPYQPVKLDVEVRKVAANAQEFESYSIKEYVKRQNITQRPGAEGIYHIVLEEGTGDRLKSNDKVKVHYTGYYIDNMEVFDSSRRHGEPFDVVIDKSPVIEGWHLGLKRMKVGEKARLIIPSALGYGPEGSPPHIGPYSPLVFDIEVVEKVSDNE